MATPKKITRILIYFASFIILVYATSFLRSLFLLSSLPVGDNFTSNNNKGKSLKSSSSQTKDKKIMNPHDFHMILENDKLCSTVDKVKVLILVTSSVSHLDQRTAIRNTWGSEYLAKEGVVLGFLLASPQNSTKQKEIAEEFKKFDDILQEDFIDSYMNLTLKTIMGIKWASRNCPNAEFVMKTDDDIYINIPLLLDNLEKLEDKKIFYGCVKQQKSFQPVLTNSRGATLPPAHPLFVAGAGYLFAGSLLSSLYSASLHTRVIPVEDVYVSAHLARAIGVHPPLHDNRFTCGEMVMNDCDMTKAFTGHKITPKRMHDIWNKIGPNVVTSPCYRNK